MQLTALPTTADPEVVEAIEKIPEQILGRDVEKSDLIECTTINELILGKGQETPKTALRS